MDLPKRKQLRLNGYDYSSQGCYFITISTKNHKKLFWHNNELNKFGEIVEKHILLLPQKYFGVKLDNYVIMPDHIHLLITIGCDALPDNDESIMNTLNGIYVFKSIPTMVGSLKSSISKEIRKYNSDMIIWQKSYFDHIITNNEDYNKTWDYIDNNPVVYINKINEKPYVVGNGIDRSAKQR